MTKKNNKSVYKEEIGERLRIFANKNYNSISNLARELNMKQPSLQSYVSGKSVPGGEILIKLHKLGCDITWLLTGEKTGDERVIKEFLRKHKINSIEELKKKIDLIHLIKVKLKEIE